MRYAKDFYFYFIEHLKDPQNGLLTDLTLLSNTASFESWIQEQMYLYFEKYFRAKWELHEVVEGKNYYSHFLFRECEDPSIAEKHIRDLQFGYYDKNEDFNGLGSIEIKLLYAHFSKSKISEIKNSIYKQVNGKDVKGIVFGIDYGLISSTLGKPNIKDEQHENLYDAMKSLADGSDNKNLVAHNQRQTIIDDTNLVEAALSLLPPEYNGKEKRERLDIAWLNVYSMFLTCKENSD